MIADTADYAEWRYGRRFTGLVFSTGTTCQKLGWACGSFVAGHALAYFGYVANVEQTPETLKGIKLLMSFIPSGLAFVGAAIALLYGITPKMAKQIEMDLAARRNDG